MDYINKLATEVRHIKKKNKAIEDGKRIAISILLTIILFLLFIFYILAGN